MEPNTIQELKDVHGTKPCAEDYCNTKVPDLETHKKCHHCVLGKERAEADTPEGGWPRGSDADRI